MLLRPPHPLLEPVADWCLDHVGTEPAHLIGVLPGRDSVSLQLIELCSDDPVGELSELVAPSCWELVVVVSTVRLWQQTVCRTDDARLAYAVDRFGNTITEVRSRGSDRTSCKDIGGRLHDICRQLMTDSPLGP